MPDNGAAGRGPRYLVMYLEHLQFYVKVLSEKPASTLIKNEQILRDVLVDGPARTLARMVFELKTYKEAETLGASPSQKGSGAAPQPVPAHADAQPRRNAHLPRTNLTP